MNVVVCLHAPAGAGPKPGAIGRADALALEQALALAARETGHEVIALLAGTPAQASPLEEALAAGAERAVRLADEDLRDADFHTFGQAFASGIKRLGADLVLTGLGPEGETIGAVAAATARQLGFVHVSAIEEIASGPPDPSGAPTVEVVVRGGGRRRRLQVTLPALFSVGAGTGAPAPPSAADPTNEAGKRGKGPKKDIEVLCLADPERTLVRRRAELLGSPEPASRSRQTVDSAAAFVAALRGD